MSMSTSVRESRRFLPEGVRLGAAAAAVTWVWVLLLDLLAGQPLHAFDVLGGVVPFTIGHAVLHIVYASVVVAAARASTEAPSLVIALIFGFVMMEIAFAMLAVILGQNGLGTLAWAQVFGGSLLGLGIVGAHLLRHYPMAALLHRAEEEL